MSPPLTEPEAVDFFSHVFRGKHHIPGKLRDLGGGCWACSAYVCSLGLSTYDDDMLTRLVFAAHDYGYRLFVEPSAPRYVQIGITRRDPSAETIVEGHDTLAEAVSKWRARNPLEVEP